MLSPSWPSPATGRRIPLPPSVRRRVRRAEAHAALYAAKRSGRNRIVADELSAAMQRQELASTG